MHWLDRKIPKRKLRTWIKEFNYITLNVSDLREIEDIENCLKSHLQNDFLIGIAVVNSSLIYKRINLLESLVLDLGGKTKFTNYYSLSSNLGKNDKINIQIKQEIATHLNANSITISDTTQTPIHIEQKPKSYLQEENANELLDEFIEGLNNFSINDSFLLIIEFLEGGFSELDGEFKYWFKERFIKKMRNKKNVKIVVLDHGKSDMKLKSENHIDIDEMIDYNDVYDTIETYQKTIFSSSSNELDTRWLALMLTSSDGRESQNVRYKEASRTFQVFCKLSSG